jgi:hypothetical protein
MELEQIVAVIDAEIDRLTRARGILTGGRMSGGSQAGATQAAPAAKPGRKRTRFMSAEARKRISDAQKKRWAAQRKRK